MFGWWAVFWSGFFLVVGCLSCLWCACLVGFSWCLLVCFEPVRFKLPGYVGELVVLCEV